MKQSIRSSLFFVLFISFAALLEAQPGKTFSGQITDSLSRQALPNATVILRSKAHTAWQRQTLTNNKGIFTIHEIPAGLYSMEVNYIGYKPFTRDSITFDGTGAQPPLAIRLSLAIGSLKAVTISAAKPFIVAEADKIVMNVAESPVAAGNNAWELLQRAPGVVDQNGELTFRGKNINVLINGRPSNMNGEDLKNMLHSTQASQIEKIELISNPGARYDAEGGAVINIKLARNKNFGTNGIFTAGIGTGVYGRYNSSLNLNNRNKKTNLYGSYNFQHTTVYQHNRSERLLGANKILENEYERRYRDNNAYQLGLDYEIDRKNSLSVLVKGYVNFRDRKVENTSIFDHAHEQSDSSSKVFTNGYARFLSPSVNLFYKSVLDKKGKELTVNADYFNYQKTWRNEFVTRFYDKTGEEYTAPYLLKDNSPADITVMSASVDYIHPAKKGKWEMGIKSTFSETDNDILWHFRDTDNWKTDWNKTNHFIYKENINAAYITYSRLFKKKYNIQAGLRAEHTRTEGNSISEQKITSNDYVNFFPNIQLLYMQNPKNNWMFAYRKSVNRYGFSFVNPAIIYQSQYAYSEGNPYLRPQINHSIEISHIYKYQIITAFNYMRSVKALAPVYRSSGNLLVSSYDNLGTYNIATLTVTYNKPVKKWWTTVTTAGQFYMDVNFEGQTTARSNRALSSYLSSNNTFKLPKKFTAELTAFYRGAFASGIYKVNAYFNMNAGVSKSLWNGKGTLALNVTDIFNTQQFTNRVENFQQVNGTFINKAETRFVNCSFTLQFGNKNVKAGKVRKTGIEEEKSRTGVN